MMRSPSATPPLTRPLEVAAIPDAGLRQSVVATEAERWTLAALGDVVGIETLTADLAIRREGRWGVRVRGEVKARITRACVVSLDDFESDLIEAVDVAFQPQGEIDAEAARRAKAPAKEDEELDDLPDPIVNGRIDLGAIVAEFFALGLDPYPKKPGTVFVEPEAASDTGADVSPFAVLSRLKPS